MSPRLVRDLMSPDPETLERNDRLSIADEVMKMKRIRHLPVLDESGRLAGILSQRDLFFNALLRALGFGTYATEKTLEEVRVKECMREDVLTVSPHDEYLETILFDNRSALSSNGPHRAALPGARLTPAIHLGDRCGHQRTGTSENPCLLTELEVPIALSGATISDT